MKKIWLLLWLSLVGISVFAAEDTITEQAEQFYAAGNYEEAADIYRQILDEGWESADLYYNLGNCYYKSGNHTRAILNYERALLLRPGDAMARYNLEMAQQSIVDKIEVLPEFFLVRWYKALETSLSADQWGYLSVAGFIVFLVMAALFFYSHSVVVKKTGFIVGIIAFFLTLGTVFWAFRQEYRISNREYAIVVTPSVTVKGAPNECGTSHFRIHEGLKVQVVEKLGDWYNIRLADGNEGWVENSDIEKI